MVLSSQVNIHSEKGQKKSDPQLIIELSNSNILIVGYGVVGSAFEKILIDAGYPHDICDPYILHGRKLRERYHTLHICIPCYYEDIFVDTVMGYIKAFYPEYIIIHSTIGIFTLKKIWEQCKHKNVKLFHAPVRAVEDEGADGIRKRKIFVGGMNPTIDKSLDHYLNKLGLDIEWVRSYKESALGKIVDTSWYGMVISFANQIQKYCDEHDIDFEESYIEPMRTGDIGREYFRDSPNQRAVPEDDEILIQRPVNIPGVIRGHCVMPNMKFLAELGKDGLVDWIKSMNNYMKIKEVNENGKI